MSLYGLFTLCLALIFHAVALCAGDDCYGASREDKTVVRGYKGNGDVTVELAVSGPPEREWALLRIRGANNETGAVLHQASVQRSPVSTSFVETIDGVSRTIFVVQMHQGFIPSPNSAPYVLGESASLELLSKLGLEAEQFRLDQLAAWQEATSFTPLHTSP